MQAKRSYIPWIFYDLYDFFTFSGIPVLIMSIIIIKNLFNKDIFTFSFFGVLLILDISGLSRAESGRIWMPYMPFLASIVAYYLTDRLKLSSKLFITILFLQFIQILFIQEFWVTLW